MGLPDRLTFSALTTSILMPIASKFSLLDEPDSRKRHRVATPLVGGIAIFFALCMCTMLGDAGSALLGFILAYVLIDFSQGPSRIFSPVLAGWIVGLPLLDASAVITRRVLEGVSPVKPDRMHLHHRLIDWGMSVERTVVTMIGIHLFLISVGITTTFMVPAWSDAILFWGFVFLVLLQTKIYPTFVDFQFRNPKQLKARLQ